MGYIRCQFWTLGPRQGVPCIGFPYKSGRAICIFLVQVSSTTLCKLVKPLRSQFVFMLPSSKVDKLKSRRKLPPPPDPRHDSCAKIGGFATNARYYFFLGGGGQLLWCGGIFDTWCSIRTEPASHRRAALGASKSVRKLKVINKRFKTFELQVQELGSVNSWRTLAKYKTKSS